ncbi:uncharacterized protein LOC119094953 [Pollicipes pollicipes]|uniref:uncharacterized protein LOC119094953 n=1 Tax=Pollicipes pollicipes TaxID=41117 RepID=UPI0018858831|nr:uncharacterized protein LOC119094953 [Pollicipes pollicipes]
MQSEMAAIGVSGFLLHWWGRRTVLIGSAVLTGLGQLTAAAHFHFEAALGGHTWLVMVGIIVANAASLGGISQLSHLYMGETLPVSVRQMVGCVISLELGACTMAFIHLFPVLREALGLSGLFAALAGVNVAAAVVMSMTPTIYGATLSFAAHLLAESQSSDATAQLTLRDATMVAAISNLGRMFACVASASLTDRLGVLRVIQLSVPFNLLAWPLMTLGGRNMMIAGAMIAGGIVGLSGLTGRLYIAEVHLIFTDWDVAKPCLLMFVQFFFETFCGGVVLNQYALSVFQMAAMSLTPSQCAQVLAVLQMAAIGVSGFLLHWWGRRTVLIGSAVLTGLGQLTAAAYFHFEAALSAHTWLVMVGIIVANAASMGGISQLSHLYLGETLPVSVRQMYGSAISLYMGALSMAFIHLFPVLKGTLSLSGLFAALAGVNVLQVVFARCLLPETRGLTLEQVQFKHFSTKRREEEPAEATAAAAAAKEAQERPEEEVDANKARPDSEEEQLENGTVGCETSKGKETDTDRTTPDTEVITTDTEREAPDTEVITTDTERTAPDTEVIPTDTERAAPDTKVVALDTQMATLDTKVATAENKQAAPDTEVITADTERVTVQPAA